MFVSSENAFFLRIITDGDVPLANCWTPPLRQILLTLLEYVSIDALLLAVVSDSVNIILFEEYASVCRQSANSVYAALLKPGMLAFAVDSSVLVVGR